MDILWTSQDKLVIVQSEQRKLTPEEAGFIKPDEYVSKTIEKDRFCCKNCVRYIPNERACWIVDGQDIEDLDCCNQFLSKRIYKEQPSKQQPLLSQDNEKDEVYIESGALSSEDASAIVNGTYRIVVDDERVVNQIYTFQSSHYGFPDPRIQSKTKRSRKSKYSKSTKSYNPEQIRCQCQIV
jgi:hypothetical protein